jgi:2-polyprenyl-3-methyl-5-hydroxy-6-metoxy-1,4-benzoquinol methylase
MESSFYEDYYRHENGHWWFRWRYELITKLVRSLKNKPEFRILDAGCGTGQMTKRLEALGEAVGLDSAQEAIDYARSRGVECLVRGSITAPPFADGSFDCVLALDVIEHVDDDIGILLSLYQVIKPGGHLIITVPAFDTLWSEHDEINHHKRRYRSPRLRHLIAEAGFEIDRLSYCNTTLYFPVLATRKAKNLWRAVSRTKPGENRPLQSDLGDYPKPVNELLFNLMRLETKLMDRVDMPFGVSILAVARKPETPIGVEIRTVDFAAASFVNPASAGATELTPALNVAAVVGVGSSDQAHADASIF